MVQGWNDAELVLNGVIERLVPQYHLLDNADNLSAQPMLCLAAHEHYYTICARVFQAGLFEYGFLSAGTVQTLRALNRPDFEWLGNVTVEALVWLRLNNENEDFRRRLDDFVHGLGEASLQDLDRVTAEVARGIGSLLIDHQQQLKKIQSKYTREHAKTAAELVLTLAALFIPSLAPFVPIIGGIGGVGKYAFNKIDEFSEKRAAAKSMMGVLASANSKSRSR